MKVLSFIIVILLIIVVLLFIGWSRAPDMLANYLSKRMGVTVQVGDLRLKMNDIKLFKHL
jgi:hypothetical protein